MEELIDLIATDGSATEVSDRIKDLLYAKAAEKVDGARPYIATSMFGDELENQDDEIEYEDGEEDDEDYSEDQE